jgi:predicted aldo/keto reductase-like oxidoreductase
LLDLPGTRPIWKFGDKKRKPADWALQWLWNQHEVSVTLSGMSTIEEVEENIASAAASGVGPLRDKGLVMFDAARETIKSRSPIPCKRCEYCLPCPNGVNIPLNFDTYNQAAMFEDVEQSRFAYKNWIPEDEQASYCIQCDECLSKCLQQIRISPWMPIVEDVLGLGRSYVISI